MAPQTFGELLEALRWSQRDLAGLLDCNERLVRRWSAGEASIPVAVAIWLTERAAAHLASPPPADWKRRNGQAA